MNTIPQLLQEAAARFGPKPALVIQRGYRTERWSYGYLWELSGRLAKYLLGKGLKPGDRVLLWAPNMPEWVGLYFGCLRAGIILVPLDVRCAPDFVAKVKNKTDARYLFISETMRQTVPEIGITVQYIEALPQEVAETTPDSSLPLPAESDIAEIIFTSGTTGEPKGVVLTHRNIISNALAATQIVPVSEKSRVLSLLPLSHMLEQTAGLLGFLHSGATIVYPASRQPGEIFRTLTQHRISNIVLVPQILKLFWNAIERGAQNQGKGRMLQRLLAISARLPMPFRRLLLLPVHKQLGGCLQFFICGGAYLDPALARRWESLGIPTLQGYGTTEASPCVTVNPLKERRLDSVGKLLPGQEMKIASDGEILIRGTNLTSGYWQSPEATAASFDGDWYKTGDLGHLDEKGYLYLKGRKKDMIVLASGMNVHAQDVEEALKICPGVKDACVVGVSGQDGDVNVHAVLLLEESALSPENIVQQANGRLAEHQRIRAFTVWPFESFPLTHTLKVKKQEVLAHVLREAAGQTPPTPALSPEKSSDSPPVYRLLSGLAEMPVENIHSSMSLEADFKLDSLGRVELLSAIESELGLYVDEASISSETTVAELEYLIASAGSASKEEVRLEWPLNRLARLGRAVLGTSLVFPLLRLFASIEVRGKENLKGLSPPVLFAANHQSHLDTPVILSSLPESWRRRVAVAAAADFWFAAGRGKTFLATLLFNAFPFSRTDAIRPTLEHCSRLLDRGWSVLIYPEGTRSETGEMAPFKSGTGMMAVELGVPVVPIHVRGTHEILPRGQSMPKRGKVRVQIGKPLRFPLKTRYCDATAAVEEAEKQLELENR